MITNNKLILLFILLTFILAGCEVIQTTNPSDVNLTVEGNTTPSEPTEPSTGGGTNGTITLEPAGNIQIEVSKNVNVKVIVKDSTGQEVPSENITVNIVDKTIVGLNQIDGRIITFAGLSAGVTSVIITASGLQTSIVITVVP